MSVRHAVALGVLLGAVLAEPSQVNAQTCDAHNDLTAVSYVGYCQTCLNGGDCSLGQSGLDCEWWRQFRSCRTGQVVGQALIPYISTGCHCPGVPLYPTWAADDSSCDPNYYSTHSTCEACDGIDNNGDGVVDEGCDRQCHDDDGRPVNYASGLEQSIHRVDFALPTYDDIFLGFERTWVQNDPLKPGLVYSAGLHETSEMPTFVGLGWRHAYSDQLIFPTTNRTISPTVHPSWISWKGQESLVFTTTSNSYVSGTPPYWKYSAAEDRGYELRFYGDQPGVNARIIRLRDNMVREFQFVSAPSWTAQSLSHQIGRIDADGWSVSTPQDPVGYMQYGPYTNQIDAGAHTAVWNMMVDNNTYDNTVVVHLDVYDSTSASVLASRDVRRTEWTSTYQYQPFSVPFTVSSPQIGHQLEFRVYWYRTSYVRERDVTIDGTSATSFTHGAGALLSKLSRPPNRTTFDGGYYVSLHRDAMGRITRTCDAENANPSSDPTCATGGRSLTFEYFGTTSLVHRIYKGATVLVEFVYASTNFQDANSWYLERVKRFDGATYERYLYQDVADTSGNITKQLSAVIRPVAPALESSAPAASAPLQATVNSALGEVAVETHAYRPDGRVSRSTSVDADFGYDYPVGNTIQYDLNQPYEPNGVLVACSSDTSCGQSGYGCWKNTAAVGGSGYCYRANVMQLDATSSHVVSTTGTCLDCGISVQREGGASQYVVSTHDADGVHITRSWDPIGRVRCVVIGDDDDTAEVAGICAGPASSRIEDHHYADDTTNGCGYTETITTLSALPGAGNVTEQITYDCRGHATASSRTGFTHNIAGQLISQVRAASYQYDSLGRLYFEDGPLPTSAGNDTVTLAYYPNSGSDANRLYTATRYANGVALTTTYANYDLFGTARSVTAPSGVVQLLVTDGRGRTTTSTVPDSMYGDTVVTTVYNGNDSLLRRMDSDLICTTYDYLAGGRIGAKRVSGTPPCGVVPIAQGSGEVEVYGYSSTHPTFVTTVTRKLAGVVKFQRVVTDSERGQLASETRAGFPGLSRSYQYDVAGILTTVSAEDCVGNAACTRETFIADAQGRRTTDRWAVAGTQYGAQTSFSYTSTTQMFPSSVQTGDGLSVATTASYVRDDFAQLVEHSSPNSGLTRWEYDVAGRMTLRRDGIGTLDVSTTAYSYDDLGRQTFVDYDTEHPVNCATAAEGTPITDEQYVYDACPSPMPPGFSCSTTSAGRLVKASTLLYCHQGAPFSRNTWFNYSAKGQLSKETIADTSAAPAVSLGYFYTTAGRLQVETLGYFQNIFARSSDNGRVTGIMNGGSPYNQYIANVTYEPFGPLTDYVVLGTDSDFHEKRVVHNWDDYSYQDIKYLSAAGATTGEFSYVQDATRRVSQRSATFPAWLGLSDRYYLYDQLGRLTCELTSPLSFCPDTGDARMVAKYAYSNGAGGVAPGDRVSVQYQTSHQATTSGPAVYGYAAASDRLQSVTRPGSTLTIAVDGRGRRRSDDDSAFDDATGNKDQRTYTYLPNGRLGSITWNSPYETPVGGGWVRGYDRMTTTFAYDHRGRLFNATTWSDHVTMAAPIAQATYFYDAADHMIQWQSRVAIDPANPLAGLAAPDDYSMWFTDDEPVAVWHLHQADGSYTIKTTLTDQLGSLGPSFAYSGGSPWAPGGDVTAYGSGGDGMPFLLPGQVMSSSVVKAFNPTCFADPTASCAAVWIRDAVAVNGYRDYDPYVGSFLEPDPSDEQLTVERQRTYSYVSGNPVSRSDPYGLFEDIIGACRAQGHYDEIQSAIWNAIGQLVRCKNCNIDGFKVALINHLLTLRVLCNPFQTGTTCAQSQGASMVMGCTRPDMPGCDAYNRYGTTNDIQLFADVWADAGCRRGEGCLPSGITHEVLHIMWPYMRDATIETLAKVCVGCVPGLGR